MTSELKLINILFKCFLGCIVCISNGFLNLIIYHDFLLPPRRSSHVKSDNRNTIINIYSP